MNESLQDGRDPGGLWGEGCIYWGTIVFSSVFWKKLRKNKQNLFEQWPNKQIWKNSISVYVYMFAFPYVQQLLLLVICALYVFSCWTAAHSSFLIKQLLHCKNLHLTKWFSSILECLIFSKQVKKLSVWGDIPVQTDLIPEFSWVSFSWLVQQSA